jgi:hypothetical protein
VCQSCDFIGMCSNATVASLCPGASGQRLVRLANALSLNWLTTNHGQATDMTLSCPDHITPYFITPAVFIVLGFLVGFPGACLLLVTETTIRSSVRL